MLHHKMEPDMDPTIYIKMAELIRRGHAYLTEDSTIANDID